MDLGDTVFLDPAKADYGPARKPNARFIMLRKYRLGTTYSRELRVRILYAKPASSTSSPDCSPSKILLLLGA